MRVDIPVPITELLLENHLGISKQSPPPTVKVERDGDRQEGSR